MVRRNMELKPVDVGVALKDKVYGALKSAITSMDIYSDEVDTKLDERGLAEELGVSRTPIREALSRLEQEGLVRMVPRRGAFVVRKTKREILQMICVWGALESLAARMASANASEEEIAGLRKVFVSRLDDSRHAKAAIDEYSDKNIRFHDSIIRLSKCDLLAEMAGGLFIHMQAIRSRSARGAERVSGTVVDHLQIIEALEQRDAELAERLVREHTQQLADHVTAHLNWVD